MTTFLGAGYSTWRADTANSVFGQFKGHNSGVPRGIWQVLQLSRESMPTNIFTKLDKDQMKTCGNPNFGQFKDHNSGVPGGFCWF